MLEYPDGRKLSLVFVLPDAAMQLYTMLHADVFGLSLTPLPASAENGIARLPPGTDELVDAQLLVVNREQLAMAMDQVAPYWVRLRDVSV